MPQDQKTAIPPTDAADSLQPSAAQAPKRGRRGDPEGRRERVLAAALAVFLAEGYRSARIDDIARRAGIAKGTVYLYFRDKEDLFRSLITDYISPLVTEAEIMTAQFDGSATELLRLLVKRMRQDMFETRRKDLLRLLLAEAPRFPWLAEFHWQNVASRGLAMIRAIAQRGVDQGEFNSDALVRLPQLVSAPMLTAVLWTTIFDRFEKLDAAAFIDTYFELLMRGLRADPVAEQGIGRNAGQPS